AVRLSPKATTTRGSAAAIGEKAGKNSRTNAMVSFRMGSNSPYPEGNARFRKCRMSDPTLSLTDIRLTLQGNAGPVEILKGISLEVNRGESLALIGPSGSGKSSLLMLMGGLERASGGRVAALG